MVDSAVTLENIRTVASTRQLWTTVLDYFLSHGIEKVSYHAAATKQHPAEIATHGFPDDWVCHYISDHLEKVDPIPALATVSSAPFLWSEARERGPLSQANLAYLRELEASGLGDGLAFAVFGPRLRNAYVGLGFGQGRACPPAERVAEFQMVAQMAHLKYCELCDRDPYALPHLSTREREALEWVARGKSNSVIAELMHISPHTVDTLVRRVFEKLGVADRTSAAIKALGSGLLQYHDLDVA
ncbi:MAG: LuxR family transcriptional regulator [Pseudomonadota bacterium]